LESLGILAGGIAHDFNNLLTPMLGDASLALLDLPRNSPARVRLQRIKKAAHRAAAITNQMLAYTGKKSAAVDPLDVSQLVRDMAQLLEGAASGKAELIYELAENLPSIEADAAQLSQVVLNLITNAIESIKEGTMGRAILRTGLVESEKVELQFLYGDEGVLPGSYVFVEVVDSGCGMSAAIQAKIFDPFFTTKASGRGLGLAATIGTVRGHGGAIELESEVGQGTRFRVLFPSMGRRALSAESTEIAIEQWRGSGTALVVDDDEGVRGLVKEILERAGLKVLEAHDGSEAVEIFRNQDDEIDVVVLDRTMPRIGGEEAFDQIRQIRPDARIILLSGYSEESATWLFVSRGLDAFIHKPFEPMVLVDRVRRIFESRDRPKPSG
jgi:CheY-like chemotaxis protein